MGRLRPWDVVATEALQDCAVFTVSRALARSPTSGEVHPFYRIDAAQWVNVVALTLDEHVVMVRQWRHGACAVTLEIPGGIVDPGEAPADAAARELVEETGYRAARLRSIGSVNPNPALFGNRVHTFLASGVECAGSEPAGALRGVGLEQTSVELVPVDEVPERVARGEIDHALVVAALYWWDLDRRRSP
jgi:8-oxo-dGTP pyrophosphatase MutT (NUDIX family)